MGDRVAVVGVVGCLHAVDGAGDAVGDGACPVGVVADAHELPRVAGGGVVVVEVVLLLLLLILLFLLL